MKMNHSGCTFRGGFLHQMHTAMHHSKDHFAAHNLSTPFQITRWKAFYWSYSTKRAQILLLNFCTAIFYDLNSIWHQIIWFCKLLVKLITGLKAQNSSAWRWRSFRIKLWAKVTSTPHLRWERFEVWIASQTTHPYFFLHLPGFSSK